MAASLLPTNRVMLSGPWRTLMLALLAATRGNGLCQFPTQWAGQWFQSGVPHLISINSSALETKGRCVETEGDKFLLEDRSDRCYRCVVVHEKHANVLQYKETFCDRRDSLGNMCAQITGDAALFSMFRVDGVPVACPFQGGPPFTFTYNRGAGECRSPVSRVEPCTDSSRLLLRYQACPDVRGTESAVEELECLGWWKDGSTRYLVGRLNHAMAHSDEDRYRCFVYERTILDARRHAISYNVAQSGDATCSGLLSAIEGSRTINLMDNGADHGGGLRSRCRFAPWLLEQTHWYTFDQSTVYHFSPRNGTLRISRADGLRETRVSCHVQGGIFSDVMQTVVAHVITGCNSGYACMAFYRRDGHVIELQQSPTWNTSPDEVCSLSNFNPSLLPFVTLITSAPHLVACPHTGHYSLSGASGAQTQTLSQCGEAPGLSVGCSGKPDTMEFSSSSCAASEPPSTYSCHGSWQDNQTSFLIASPVSRESGEPRRYCFVYSVDGAGALQLASVAHSCARNASALAAWVFELTPRGHCSKSTVLRADSVPFLLLAVVFKFWSALIS